MSYDYWRNAIAGRFGAVHDGHPEPGFYKRRTAKNGPWNAVAIWESNGTMLAVEAGKPVDASDVWTWVCTHPITEDTYRRVERGEGWPDAIPEGHGSNHPPSDEAAVDEVESAIAAALLALGAPVEIQADCDRLANHRDRLAKLYKDREEKRKAEKQPHMDAAKAVDDRFNPILTKIKEAGDKLKKAITAWLLKEEERAKAEALAKLRAEEEARKAAAAANLPPPAPEPLPEIARPKAGTSGRATALRTYKSAVITDYAKALAHFAEDAEVKALIQTLADRAARADVVIPGCEIRTERKAA